MDKKYFAKLSIFILITVLVTALVTTAILAEQSGDSPESGATSRIRSTYDSLVALAYGSEAAGAWGDWGPIWNRIRSASEWIPQGTATEADVLGGVTFIGNSRTELTGTAVLSFPNFAPQQYEEFNDYEGPWNDLAEEEEYSNDEAIWTNTSTDVWKDERTGLYWSNIIGTYTNVFPNQDHSTCDFFSATPRGSYDGSDADCGNAINACATLELDANDDGIAETDWYLPTHVQLLQAYVDGIFNKTDAWFVGYPIAYYLSSTDQSDMDGRAWAVSLANGNSFNAVKTDPLKAHCVR